MFVASTNFLLAEVYKIESFSLTTHHFAGAVVDQYTNNDGVFKSTKKVLEMNSNDPNEDRFTNPKLNFNRQTTQ